jgi:acetoin:2,6-dichlorophenolindophenol oxidoreductase subunit beta
MADSNGTLEYRVAIREAIAAEMERDERVVFFGEDVAIAGGVFAVTPGL